jgi:hypothetical protein
LVAAFRAPCPPPAQQFPLLLIVTLRSVSLLFSSHPADCFVFAACSRLVVAKVFLGIAVKKSGALTGRVGSADIREIRGLSLFFHKLAVSELRI